jgi:hypothetical protein
MSTQLIEELRKENLCTHFILPLLKLSKFSFVASNFVNCYITKQSLPSKTTIVVQVIDFHLLGPNMLFNPHFLRYFTDDKGYHYLEFFVPSKWRVDVVYFRTGRFSLMSKSAKEYIQRYSMLPYQLYNNGKVLTDMRLLALNKHPTLKTMWENELSYNEAFTSIVELDDDAELLSIPGDESYIDLTSSSFTLIHDLNEKARP